jgi:hypothetical protein
MAIVTYFFYSSGSIPGIPGVWGGVQVDVNTVTNTVVATRPLNSVISPLPVTYAPPLDYFNVVTYGAYGDGVHDDTAAIAAAIASAPNGGTIYFPPGTYLATNFSLTSGIYLVGSGIGATTIKLKNSTNTDLISMQANLINLSASPNTGSTGTLSNFGISSLTLDGNKANQSSGTSYPLRFYGYNFILRDVQILNGYTGGALIDWNGASFIGEPSDEMESYIDTCKFHGCNGIGLQMGGPHDSRWHNVLSFNHGAHNFHIAPNATGILATNCHGYANPNTANVVDYLIEAPGCQFTNCVGEGSYHADVVILANNTSWVGGNIYNGSSAAGAIGMQLGQQAGQTPYTGQILQSAGVTTAANVGGCFIQTIFTSYVASSINFANEGNNSIEANIFQTSGTAITGTPATSDYYNLVVRGLTPDGTVGKGGGVQIVSDSAPALSVQSANGLVFQIDRFGNLYQNGGINTAAGFYFTASTTANSLASSGTIGVQGLSNIVVAPTADVTGVIMQAGYGGQCSAVVNASNFSIQFAASGTSHVALGTSEVIAPNSMKMYFYDGTNSLWYAISSMSAPAQSATAPATASSGTITTADVSVARVSPTGAVTGVILQSGTVAGQIVAVINEATAANSVTFAASGTSHVAGGTSIVIAGGAKQIFVWDSSTNLWY